MAEQALDDLLEIMRDQRIGMRDRINAGVSASRVSMLSMPGEELPEAIAFLRGIIDYRGAHGEQFSPQFRRECAAAVAYHQRRSAKAALQFDVVDRDQQRREWFALANASLRCRLATLGAWPERRDVLFRNDDELLHPPGDAERGMTALLRPIGINQSARRRLRSLDDPGGPPEIASEAERHALLKPLARLVRQRLVERSAA